MSQNHPNFHMLEQQTKDFKALRVLYDFTLADAHLVKVLAHTYQVHMHLLKKWGSVNLSQMAFKEEQALFCYLPESFVTDVIEFNTHVLKTNPKGISVFQPDYLVDLVEFCIIVVRSGKCISNPYSKAKALQLISYLIQADKKK